MHENHAIKHGNGKLLHHTISLYGSDLLVYAGVAQLAEQLICNQQVISSSLIAGSSLFYSGRGRYARSERNALFRFSQDQA